MENKGIFGSLFDFSFNSYVTTKIIKLLYILVTAGCLFSLITATYTQGFMGFIGGLVGAAVMFLLCRIYLELMIVLFRMAENLELIAGRCGTEETNVPPLNPGGAEKTG